MPGQVVDLTRNRGGRQAGTLLQGAAVLILAGRGDAPGPITALPMLPQTWYVIEPGAWHAAVQAHGTICAWAEAIACGSLSSAISRPRGPSRSRISRLCPPRPKVPST